MKEIKYKNKTYKLPFSVSLPEDPTEEEKISNRFGGGSCMLPAFAVAVYDVIMGSELFQNWEDHAKGLDWFRQHFPKEYMVLLDSHMNTPGANAPGVPDQIQKSK